MEGRPLAFSNHCSENALSSVGGGVEGGGGVAVMMMPQADTISSTALNLSTYTAGEDAGRLALLAKEFGLAKIRPPKRQIRKHTFKVRVEDYNSSFDVCLCTYMNMCSLLINVMMTSQTPQTIAKYQYM